MDMLYIAIIAAVVVIAAAIAFMAWTGGYEGMNPITIDNVIDNGLLRPKAETP